MIKDFYLEKEISNFGKEKIFAINSVYHPEKGLKNIPENKVVSKTEKGIFLLDDEYAAEDNIYPYQALLFDIARQIQNGIIIVEYTSDIRIVTAVKNSIPMLSNTIITSDEVAFNAQLSRFAVANDVGNTAVYITENDYSLKYIKTSFMMPEELMQLERKLFIKNKILVFGSIFLLLGYCLNAIPSTIEHKKLSNEIRILEEEKQRLARKITPTVHQESIDIKVLEQENHNTQKLINQLKEIVEREPILKIKNASGNAYIVTDFSPDFKEKLSKFNPKYTNKISEAVIEIK